MKFRFFLIFCFIISSHLYSRLLPHLDLNTNESKRSDHSIDYDLIVKFRNDFTVMLNSDSTIDYFKYTKLNGIKFSHILKPDNGKWKKFVMRILNKTLRLADGEFNFFKVHLEEQSTDTHSKIAGLLKKSNKVECVYFQPVRIPPPLDIAPPSEYLGSRQIYFGDFPGFNFDYAWKRSAKGMGIRFSMCEYGWNPDHEDLNEIELNLEPGQTIHPYVYNKGWEEHGTAVVGITSSLINEYGCNGIVPLASIFTFPELTVEENNRRITCIANAIMNSSPGDVILLEMQTYGYDDQYVPAEYDPAVWTLVKAATDAGIVVVAGAGNGRQNLDDSSYVEYMNRGDSGAIIVGSCYPDSLNKRTSSTYGSRVDIAAWGAYVFTLGYGNYIEYGNDKNQRYTHEFAGTSSASAFVAAACVSIQSFLCNIQKEFLSPIEIRELLVQTGIIFSDSLRIGPLLNVKNAIKSIEKSIPQAVFQFVQNYPNPFNTFTKIKFFLTIPSDVFFDVFDVLGRRVYSDIYFDSQYGYNIIEFNNPELPSGTYFYRIKNKNEVKSQKMTIIK